MPRNPTAIIYTRVSTARQADDGLPIESQIEQGYKKAAALDADVVRVFTDAGISGRTDERPSFREAVRYCKAYSVEYFICWSTLSKARGVTIERRNPPCFWLAVIRNTAHHGYRPLQAPFRDYLLLLAVLSHVQG